MKIIIFMYGKNKADFSGATCYDVKLVADDYSIDGHIASWEETINNRGSGKTWYLIEEREYQENPPKIGAVIATHFNARPRVDRVEINKQEENKAERIMKFYANPAVWPQFAIGQMVFDEAVPNPPQPGEQF